MTPAELLEAHPHVSVLTVDFFDTLVTRSVAQPTHVFAVMEERLVASHGLKWDGFAVKRVTAERRARAALAADDEHADVTIEEILVELSIIMNLSMNERTMLLQLEQDTEVELARPVVFGAELLQLATTRGLDTWIVSDNYMPSTHIVRMAAAAGVSLDASQVLVSCEHGAMKHDGSLWPVVMERVGVTPDRVLHVGDLHDADGAIPDRKSTRLNSSH